MPTIVRRDVVEDGIETYRLFMWCPGCEDVHAINSKWEWDGDEERPTINPSILVISGDERRPGAMTRCHSFIRQGRWEFLDDCTHMLAQQKVPMVPVPLDAKGVL